MKLDTVKIFSFLIVVLSFFIILLFPSTASSSEKYEKYVNASCAAMCFACQNTSELLTDEMRNLCLKQTYDDLNSCRKLCLEKQIMEVDRNESLDGIMEIMDSCADCQKDSTKCEGFYTPDFCKAIENDRDMVQVVTNMKLVGVDGKEKVMIDCPSGSSLDKEEKKCVCEAGKEFDSLHTACLNKQATVDNIKTLLDFLPPEILDEIKKKAQEHISESLDKDASLLSLSDKAKENLKLLGGMVSSQLISDGALAELIYTNIIYNTDNLRQLIKYLGKNKTEKLIELLEKITSREKEKTQEQNPQKEPTSTGQTTKQTFDDATWKKIEEIHKKQDQLAEEKWQACPVHNSECAPICNYDLSDLDCLEKCSVDKGCYICSKDSDCEGVYDSVSLKAKCETKVTHQCIEDVPWYK